MTVNQSRFFLGISSRTLLTWHIYGIFWQICEQAVVSVLCMRQASFFFSTQVRLETGRTPSQRSRTSFSTASSGQRWRTAPSSLCGGSRGKCWRDVKWSSASRVSFLLIPHVQSTGDPDVSQSTSTLTNDILAPHTSRAYLCVVLCVYQ